MQPALKTLADLRRGQFAEDLDGELRHLVDAVIDTGRGGELTIKLKITPAGDDGTTLEILDSFTVKLPRPTTGRTILYRADDGRLSRRDAGQLELDVELVNGMLRDAGDPPGQGKRGAKH